MQEIETASAAILARVKDRRPQRWGIGSAAAYVRQMEMHAADRKAFEESLRRAESQPVYCDEDLLIKGHRLKEADDPDPSKPLMKFKATITATRRDRDGDILESKGARPDMDGPLLLNHDYGLIIGKPLRAIAHNSKRYAEELAIVNSPDPKSPLGLLARDVATLIDFGALRRMSHGFMPDENTDEDDPAYEEMLDKEGNFLGWKIHRFEIWERSVVAVASNVDAFITAFSREKLVAPMIKSWGRELFDERPTAVKGVTLPRYEDNSEDDTVAGGSGEDNVGDTDNAPAPLLNDERSGGANAVPRIQKDADAPPPDLKTEEPKAETEKKSIPGNPSNGSGDGVEGTWSRLKLSDFTEEQWGDLSASQKATISKYFAWYTPDDTFDAACHLGHHFPPGHASAGKPSLNGIRNALARANQVSGLSGDDLDRVMAHLRTHLPERSATDESEKKTQEGNCGVEQGPLGGPAKTRRDCPPQDKLKGVHTMHETLKQYATAHLGVAADADEKEFETAVLQAHINGDLTLEQIQKMGRGEAVETDADLETAAALIGKAVAEAMGPVNKALGNLADRMDQLETQDPTDPDDKTTEPPNEPTESDKLIAASAGINPKVRMKSPIEVGGYKTAREIARFPEHRKGGRPHPLAGEQVTYGRGQNARLMKQNSEADYAQIGAWLKWNLTGGGRLTDNPWLDEHERQLVNYTLDKGEWACGTSSPMIREWDGVRRLDSATKASLLNDTTSGGSYAVPRQFDDELFMNPILYGELVPWVSILDLQQGSVVDGAYLAGTLSITSNTAEGSAITLFDATGLIGNLDTTIYTCSIGIEMGLDFLQDQAMDVGRILPQRMGERLQEWLDNQIANGDGTTEPEGIFNKSGVGTTGSANGTAGAITVGDIENLLFGLTRARRKQAGTNARFVTNDTMYLRACQVPVGTSDARRVLKPNMDHENYQLMARGVSIEEHVANGTIGFCALDEYRLVRRLGSQLRETTEGSTLIKANDKIIVLRARFGGQLTLAGALHKITDLDQSVAP